MRLDNIRKSIFLGILIGVVIQIFLLWIGTDNEFNIDLIIKLFLTILITTIFIILYNRKKDSPIISDPVEIIVAIIGIGLILFIIFAGMNLIG